MPPIGRGVGMSRGRRRNVPLVPLALAYWEPQCQMTSKRYFVFLPRLYSGSRVSGTVRCLSLSALDSNKRSSDSLGKRACRIQECIGELHR